MRRFLVILGLLAALSLAAPVGAAGYTPYGVPEPYLVHVDSWVGTSFFGNVDVPCNGGHHVVFYAHMSQPLWAWNSDGTRRLVYAEWRMWLASDWNLYHGAVFLGNYIYNEQEGQCLELHTPLYGIDYVATYQEVTQPNGVTSGVSASC